MSENCRQEDDDPLLDRQTRDYIRSKVDPEDPALKGFGQVIKQAREKVTSSRTFLQQSVDKVTDNVHRLQTFLQAPRGWFLHLCVGHVLHVPLVPTFPAHDPCEEVRQAARDTLFLQFCVDDFHAPAQLIVREIRVRCLDSDGHGDVENVPVASGSLKETEFSEVQFQHAVNEIMPLSDSSADSTPKSTSSQKLVMRTSKSAKTETLSAQTDSNMPKKAIQNTFQEEFCFPSANSSPAFARQKLNFSPRTVLSPSEITLEQVPHMNSPQARSRRRSQPMSPESREEASESILSCLPGSTSESGLPDDPSSSLSQIQSSLLSVQVDPMSFSPEGTTSKDSSQNARSSPYCRPSPLSHSKLTDNSFDVTTDNHFSEHRAYQKTAGKDLHQQKNEGPGEVLTIQYPIQDVRIVRESKEALMPELSEDRVLVRGHYTNTVNGETLPFTVFVHKDLGVQGDPHQLRLCGSYIRAMLTVKKNLRWRFQHTIEQVDLG